jgi:phage-related minor tail protein
MATAIERIYRLQVDANKAVRNLQKTNKEVTKVSRSFTKLAKTAGATLAAYASVQGVRALVGQTRAALDYADALAKTASFTGISVEALQELSFAAGQSGVNTNLLNSSLTAFVKRVGEAKNGMGPLSSGLKQNNQELLTALAATNSQEEALNLLADAIENAETASAKAVIANAAFGRSGISLVNVLKNGREGLADYAAQAQSLGIILGDDLATQSEVINDKLDILGLTIGTKVKTGFIEAAAAAFEFFGVFSDAQRLENAIAQTEASLEKVGERLEQTANRRGRSNNADRIRQEKLIEQLRDQIAQREKLATYGQPASVVPDGTVDDAVAAAAALTKLTSELNSLQDSYDPLGAASRKFAEEQSKLVALQDSLTDTQFLIYQEALVAAYEAKIDSITGVTAAQKLLATEEAKYADTLQSILDLALPQLAAQEKLTAQIDFLALAYTNNKISVELYNEALKALIITEDLQADNLQGVLDTALPQLAAQRELTAQINILAEAYTAGEIGVKLYTDALAGLILAEEEVKEQTASMSEAIGTVAADAVDNFASSILDLSKGGKDAFKKFANSVIQDLARIIIQTQILNAISGTSFGSFLGLTPSAKGNAFANGAIQPFANGGIVSSPTLFGFGGGNVGLAGEAGSEAILPLSRGSNGNLGVESTVNVNVTNNTPATVDVQQQGNDIQIVIGQVASDIASGGEISRALESSFGVSRAGVAY